MTEVKIPTIEIEEAYQLALATWGQMYDFSFQALAEKFGAEESLNILRPHLEKVGEQAPIFAEMMGIKGNDAIAIASLFCLYEEQVLKVEGKIVEQSSDRVVKESSKCPFQGLSSGFCEAFTCISQGMAKAINPDFTVTLTKAMTKGDPICEWIVEKK